MSQMVFGCQVPLLHGGKLPLLHTRFTCSAHRSATAHGFRQSVAFPLTICAVAVARTPCSVLPNSGAKNVGNALFPSLR